MSLPASTSQAIEALTGGKLGVHDIPCPFCGPQRRSGTNQRRKVFRLWRIDPNFATYHCARCGEGGSLRDNDAVRPDPAALERARAEAAAREVKSKSERLKKAKWLLSQRRPIVGSIAETYLRTARGYGGGALPPTLGFLPARGKHGPAMIAAFGFPEEPEPGELAITDRAVRAVHLTRLLPDGSDRERGEAAKLMIGVVGGSPIVLAAVNDLGGLAIVEGIEDGLTVFEATGLGVWVAGAASFMPALADRIPAYVEAVTIYAHDDGRPVRGCLSCRKTGRSRP